MWPYLLRDALPTRLRRSLVYLFVVLTEMHGNVFTLERINDLVENIKIDIALLQRDCILYLGNITTNSQCRENSH